MSDWQFKTWTVEFMLRHDFAVSFVKSVVRCEIILKINV